MMERIFKRVVHLGIALCIGVVCFAVPAAAAVEDFVGTWVNVGRDTGGVTHLVVTRTGLGANLQVFGNCEPRDCNWGNARGTIYSSGVSRDSLRNANAITANFTAGFSQKFVVLREARANQITVEIYTSFTDRSRRPNYITSVRMRRGQGPGAGYSGGNQQNPDGWWRQQYGQNYTYRDDAFYQQCRQSSDPAGIIAGALIGGLLGNVVGQGGGRTGATIAGVIVGGALGATLTSNLDCEDRSYAYKTYYDGFNSGRANSSYPWRNQRSGNYGTFNVGEYYDDPYGFRCATYSQEIYIQGRPQEARGRACQQPDGTWAIVN